MRLTLGQVADAIHAEGDFTTKTEVVGYSIDSRTIGAGELYFAVKGERLDGHDFVEAALANGAAAAVVSMRWLAPSELDPCRLLRVPDHDGAGVLDALQRLARAVRQMWGGRVIGVTGSAGKTTTKEMVAAVLATKFQVLKSAGNLNNGFGVPLQLLRLEPEHEVAVIEMGMNHAGEIAALAKIAEPDWAVVSNVASVHLEYFPEGIAGIAAAKRELVEALPADGLAFLNADDVWVREFGRGMGERVTYFGTAEEAAVRAEKLEERGLWGTDFDLCIPGGDRNVPMVMRMPGRHNVMNALAGVAVGLRSGVPRMDAMSALEQMRPTEKRGNRIDWNGAQIYDDTYNSNPAALAAMISALRNTRAKRRIVVAGEMLELGPEAERLHGDSGRAMTGIDVIVGVRGFARALVAGAAWTGSEAFYLETPEEAGAWMKENLQPGDVVLVKASRGVRLERALDGISHA